MRAFTGAAIQVAPVRGSLTPQVVEANIARCVDFVRRCVAETGAELGRDALERLVDVDGRANGPAHVEDELLHLEDGRLLVDETGVGAGEVVEVTREHADLEGALLLVGHGDDVVLRLAPPLRG